MGALTVDAEAMRAAIPQVEHLVALLNDMARDLDGVTVPAGVPGGLAARVQGTTRSAAQDLRAKARSLSALPDDLKRRVAAAQLADAPWLNAAGWGLRALGLHFHAFSIQNLSKSMSWGLAAREIRDGLKSGETYGAGSWKAFRLTSAAAEEASATRGVPPFLEKTAGIGGKAVTAAGWALTAYSNFSDPRLSTEQKIGRTGATIATSAGVSALSGAAAGAAFGTAAGPLGMAVGFGAGAAWTVLDNKFGVSKKIGDGAADAMEFGEKVGGDAVGTVGDGIGKVGDGVDTVTGDAKSVVSDAGDVAGGALDAIGL